MIKIYRNITVPVSFWFATRFVTLGVAHILRVFANRVLREILGLRGTNQEEWSKLHNEKLCDM